MDYKKSYEDALVSIREVYNQADAVTKATLEAKFPELAESEDERIRKNLIEWVREFKKLNPTNPEHNAECSEAISYLEKQKEQPADAKSERVIKAARRVLNNWLDGTDCPDVSGDFAELEYAIREYDGEEKQKEQKPVEWSEEDERIANEILDHFNTGNAEWFNWFNARFKSLRPQSKADLDSIAKREYARGKQEGYWEGVKAERESCKTFHYESPNWPPKMPDLPTETTTNEGVSSNKPHWKPSWEQMEALKYALGKGGAFNKEALESLREQLEKL